MRATAASAPANQARGSRPCARSYRAADRYMSLSLQRLLPLFERERARHQPMVLATVVRTAGPTYTKPGAHMLLAGDGEYAGLLSGGCLEGDLAVHGRAVLASGIAQLVHYDMRGPDDLLFGLGSGCEGAMDILLQRLDQHNGWQPMTRLAAAWRAQRAAGMLLVVNSTDPAWPPGTAVFADEGDASSINAAAAPRAAAEGSAAALQTLHAVAARLPVEHCSRFVPRAAPGIDVLALSQPPPVQMLLLGAGPDAQPVVELAAFLGWRVTVIDHRSHYAQSARFPAASAVLDGGPAALTRLLAAVPSHGCAPANAPEWAAAVIMSHHLATDLGYLRALAGSDIPYVGLLGPGVRCQRLLAELGADAPRLAGRLRAPIGLDLGAAVPESIALSIVAEIHATLAGRATIAPMSRKQA
jgi:xanthine dehydrogenase accessory factor